MLVELGKIWIVVLNLVGIPAIHFGISWIYTRMAAERFDPERFPFTECSCEQGGVLYQTLFKIRKWKAYLPDAAPWFDGFAKGSFQSKDVDYLRRFIIETCRGEAAHYAQIAGLLVTLVWNPWPIAAIVMIVYAFLSNLPCVLLQRFTRARMRKLLGELKG